MLNSVLIKWEMIGMIDEIIKEVGLTNFNFTNFTLMWTTMALFTIAVWLCMG